MLKNRWAAQMSRRRNGMPNMVFDTVPSSDEALQEFVDSVESLGLKQWLIGIGLFYCC